MLFDKLCGICERNAHLPAIVKSSAKEARLFVFPGRAHEILPYSDVCTRQDVFMGQEFFLPFDVVAIEDTASCVILGNTQKGQRGLSASRLFIEISPVSHDNSGEFQHVEGRISQTELAALPRDSHLVVWGEISSLQRLPGESACSQALYAFGGLYFGSKQGGRSFPGSTVEFQPCAEAAAKNAIVAIEELMYFNSPNRYVLETAPLDSKPLAKGRMARSSQRPTYSLMTRSEIHKRLGLQEDSGRHPCPHERRAHVRVYKHERYRASGLLGTAVVVREAWVGPSEAVVGNRRYKVRLDL